MSIQDHRNRPPTLRSLRLKAPPGQVASPGPELAARDGLSGPWAAVQRALAKAGQRWDPGQNEVLLVRTREQVVELAQWSPVAPQPLADTLPYLARAVADTMNYKFQMWSLSNRHHVGIVTGVGDRSHTVAQAQTAFVQMAEMGLRVDRSAIVDIRVGAAFLGEAATGESRLGHPDLVVVDQAELALAQTSATRPFVHYDAALQRAASTASDLALDLTEALARDDVQLGYQTRRSSTGSAVGVEALARWFHWRKGPIANDELLAVAEQTGQLPELGRRLRLSAAQKLQHWCEQDLPTGRELYCNVAPVELCHRSFRPSMRELQRLFPTPELHLEVADSAALDLAPVRQALAPLSEMGCGVILDGVSPETVSIERLRNLPLAGVNLSGSFTKRLGHDKVVNRLAEVIVELADQRNLVVTACQIESREQHAAAEAYAIDQVQGDLYAPAMTAEQLFESLSSESAVSPGPELDAPPPS